MSLNAQHDHDPDGYDRLRVGWLNRRRLDHFRARVRALEPSVVIEVGCGTGRMLSELAATFPETRFIGVEPLAGYVDYGRGLIAASGLANVEVHVGTGEDMPTLLPLHVADVLISSDVLHHVASLGKVVRNVRAVMRQGGTWVLVEPSAANPYVGLFQALTRGERNFWARPFLKETAAAGFQLVRRDRMFLIPSMVESPPEWLVALERRLEHAPVLAGAVTMELVST